ncbi:putative transcription factor B3-Domain family [Helianthus annuus]|nr:putative transcription factor B3-Domain family [Helianthus annuus]KAJ0492922.1 putative transcription factor B3-Domain family [Helianthus annuus]KAJ0505076.1 putative transcription factor B3-Domain family [Helianthus annuus]KAJ0674763.1 putative transcription factor B3-Domain family [Helianthus annuus]
MNQFLYVRMFVIKKPRSINELRTLLCFFINSVVNRSLNHIFKQWFQGLSRLFRICFIIISSSHLWHVYVEVTISGCFIIDGWSKVVTDLDVEDTDFIFFDVVADNTFEIFHFKVDRDLDVKNMFYHIMLFPAAENLISIDISLLRWDCLVFKKLEDYTFNPPEDVDVDTVVEVPDPDYDPNDDQHFDEVLAVHESPLYLLPMCMKSSASRHTDLLALIYYF